MWREWSFSDINSTSVKLRKIMGSLGYLWHLCKSRGFQSAADDERAVKDYATPTLILPLNLDWAKMLYKARLFSVPVF